MANERTVTVSFAKKDESLKQEFRRQLKEAKATDPKASRGEVAKAMMRQGMKGAAGPPIVAQDYDATAAGNQLAEVRAMVTELQQTVRSINKRSQDLRNDVASLAVILLTTASNWPEARAVNWIQENLRR